MNDETKKVELHVLQRMLEKEYDITEVSHVPRAKSAPLIARVNPPLMIGGYDLVALIAHQVKQVREMEEAVKNLEAVLYAEEGEDSE